MNLEFLYKLVIQNSKTDNKSGVDKVGEMLADRLGSFMNVKRLKHTEFGDLFVFESKVIDDSKEKIILSAHSDTVHAPDFEFPIRKVDNKLYGPGINDMKASLFVIVEVLSELNKHNLLKNINFALVPDEEFASTAHKKFLHNYYKLHQKALVYEEGSLENTPGKRKYNKNTRALVISRRGFGGGKFSVNSIGGHSGIKNKKSERPNAILEMAQKVTRLEKSADYKKLTTVNPGIIKGGTAINAIAQNCELICDYRISTLEERSRIRSEFEKIAHRSFVAGTQCSFEWLYDIPPMFFNEESKSFAEKIKEVAANSNTNLILENRFGGSDANQYCFCGVAVLDGFGPQGDNEHTDNEFIYIDSLEPTISFNIKVLKILTT